ncbi:hypothetical protein BSR29_01480 [Boudabousia liubingyangii]|uniref:DUF2871 domain-containing protein n=1 Tax=Boudabousia liubingyangii TaxID=1921764 RepID=A0A1Q5PQ27_9ACTO|nr:DUF2871 domain-containing protein [Boudabousia liubingyangii]OKL49654.1 hypothetical protein BSR29_01480 [Boudabousia liubingyangii]
MNKLLAKLAIIYMALALTGGFFYREYTKYAEFKGFTTLSILHTHYFVLGMFFFLIMLALEDRFHFLGSKLGHIGLIVYNIFLNVTVIMMIVRGVVQVGGTELAKGPNAAISGMAGLGHIGLTAGLVLILVALYQAVGAGQDRSVKQA